MGSYIYMSPEEVSRHLGISVPLLIHLLHNTDHMESFSIENEYIINRLSVTAFNIRLNMMRHVLAKCMKAGVLDEIGKAPDPDAYKGQWVDIGEGTRCNVASLISVSRLLQVSPVTVLALARMNAIPYRVVEPADPRRCKAWSPASPREVHKPRYIDFYTQEGDPMDVPPVPDPVDPGSVSIQAHG